MELWLWIMLVLLLLVLTGITGCYLWISAKAKPYIFSFPQKIPCRKYALLLGTAKRTGKGNINSFFIKRVDKTAEVFNQKKVNKIFISGADQPASAPDEVDDMLQTLIQKDIASNAITTDHKGYRTWASLWRCKYIYHISAPLIISQRFHNQRAVFIALRLKMDPIAINADSVKGMTGKKMILREALARVKCLMDCYLFKPEYPE